MYRLLLTLGILIPFSAFAMDHRSDVHLSNRQLIAIMRTTVAVKGAADMLYKKTGISKKPYPLPANIAVNVAQEVVDKAQNGVVLTDSLIISMIGDTLAKIFPTIGRTEINRIINEEIGNNLSDGIVPR